MLEDLCALIGATLISDEVGYSLEDAGMHLFGTAKKIVVTKETTTVVDGAGRAENVQKRIAQIKHEIKMSTSTYDREKLEERLAKLVGGIGVVNVGAMTEAEAE